MEPPPPEKMQKRKCPEPDFIRNTARRCYLPNDHRHADPFPFNEEPSSQALDSLRDLVTEAETLQDMVTGGLSIDAILNVLDATGEGETAWPVEKTPPDILHLLSRNTPRKQRIAPYCPI